MLTLIIYTAVRIFPAWAIPIAFIFWELGVYFRRRAEPSQHICWGIVGLFSVATLLWVFFRGDLNSDIWVRALVG